MSRIFHPLLALIASASDNELAKYVKNLKHENAILSSRLPMQIHATYEERQTLLKYGKILGRAIEELISIDSPATFSRRVRDGRNGRPKLKNPKGDKRKPQEIRELVIKIAIETGFGYTRILGGFASWVSKRLVVRPYGISRRKKVLIPAQIALLIRGMNFSSGLVKQVGVAISSL